MATEQTSRLFADVSAQASSAIENELPTYRAIRRSAIFSVICGILASFSFAHWSFLIFAGLAVLFAVLANLAINRHPDMLTGRRLANAGAALGLVFGLIVATYTAVHNFVLTRDAERFGKEYADVLVKGTLGDALWLGLHPDMRKTKTPQKTQQEFESAKTKERMMIDQKTASLQSLRKRLAASQEEHLHFIDIESHGMDETRQDELGYYALALFEVEGPGNKDFPEKKQFALAIFKARSKGRHYEWWVEEVRYPYQPRSYATAAKPVDDGHGHAPPLTSRSTKASKAGASVLNEAPLPYGSPGE